MNIKTSQIKCTYGAKIVETEGILEMLWATEDLAFRDFGAMCTAYQQKNVSNIVNESRMNGPMFQKVTHLLSQTLSFSDVK